MCHVFALIITERKLNSADIMAYTNRENRFSVFITNATYEEDVKDHHSASLSSHSNKQRHTFMMLFVQ